MYEIGYLILGRGSIFAISAILFVNSFGLIIIFINIFSHVAASLMQQLYFGDDVINAHWGVSPATYAIAIAVALLPTTFMKEIAELHLVSLSLFVAAIGFVVINLV